jgi:hypothetical protein
MEVRVHATCLKVISYRLISLNSLPGDDTHGQITHRQASKKIHTNKENCWDGTFRVSKLENQDTQKLKDLMHFFQIGLL